MTDLHCPKCSANLTVGDRPYATCSGCSGIWLTEAQYSDALAGAGGSAALIVVLQANGQATGLTCPACRNRPLLASSYRGVEIDWCDGCRGIFFDKGELERIRAVTSSGSGSITTAGEAAVEGALTVADLLFSFIDF